MAVPKRPSERHVDTCRGVDEDTIEFHAMGKLRDPAVIQHLESCISCQKRVAEHRSWIKDLKRGLGEYQPDSKNDANHNIARTRRAK
jgi:hypothetical protein